MVANTDVYAYKPSIQIDEIIKTNTDSNLNNAKNRFLAGDAVETLRPIGEHLNQSYYDNLNILNENSVIETTIDLSPRIRAALEKKKRSFCI